MLIDSEQQAVIKEEYSNIPIIHKKPVAFKSRLPPELQFLHGKANAMSSLSD
jgi:hypothetical protein